MPQAPGSCGTTQTTGFIGRLTEKYSPAATAGNFPAMAEDYLSFDACGRVLQSRQTTGTAYPVLTYTYNKQGALASMKYPSGRTVSYGFDAAARVSAVLGNANVPYVSSISYAPHGGVAQSVLHNGLIESTCYNSRVQVSQIRLATTANADPTVCAGDSNDRLNLTYGYGTTTNNGNVLSQTIVRGGASWQQTYSYGDGFNRLTGVVETALGSWCTWNCGWTESYGFDNAGNRWVTTHTGLPALSLETPVASSWFNASTNRINGWGYDASGNVQSVAGMSRSFTYDEEGRQTSALINGQTTNYFYDGDGKRVRKIAPCGTAQCTTDYIHDAAGQLVAEYSGAPVAESGTVYLTVDALGSTRVLSDAGGLVKEANDYLPFGGDLTAGVAAASGRTTAMGFNDPSAAAVGLRQDVEFTGKERDGESGLDYFGARYFSRAMGRFTTPDPNNPILNAQMITLAGLPAEAARAHMEDFLGNPQNWNSYAYVRNNPLAFVDPFGQAPVGHHLIPMRDQLTGIGREFAEAVRTGGPNVAPNIGYTTEHRAYSAAVEEVLQEAEQEFGAARNSWSLSQWQATATRILNSNVPPIRNFLDTFDRNQGGKAIPALASAIRTYRVSAGLIARMAVTGFGEELFLILRAPIMMMVDPALTASQRGREEIKKDRRNCLIDRDSGNCVN